jgi:hypothetical protein
MVEVTKSEKHSSLLKLVNYYDRKKFCSPSPWRQCQKDTFWCFRNKIIFVKVKKVYIYFFKREKQVPGRGLEQRESGKTVLYQPIIIILISYIITYYD